VRVVSGWTTCVACLALAGCTTAWKQSFEPAADIALEPLPEDERVEVRRVPWERLDAALDELEQEVIESDTHPSEWEPDRLAEREAELLSALQITAPAEEAEVLGRSVFRTTDPLRPVGKHLARFAREIGADYAIWSSRYEGEREVIERTPVSTRGFAFGGHGYPYGRGFTGVHETLYVPVVVERDEYTFVAYYVRVR